MLITKPILVRATKLLINGNLIIQSKTISYHERKALAILLTTNTNNNYCCLTKNNKLQHAPCMSYVRNASTTTTGQATGTDNDTIIARNVIYNNDDYKPICEPYVDPQMSYTYGRSNRELKYASLSKQLNELAQKEPHSTAIISYEEGISKNYEQFLADINCVMKGLVHKLKLNRGDAVGIYSYNNYQWVLIQFACVRLGLVSHPFNPSYKAPELAYVLGKANVKVLFMPGKNSCQAAINNHWDVIKDPIIKKMRDNKELSNLNEIVILDGESEPGKGSILDDVNQSKWSTLLNNDANLNTDPDIAKMMAAVVSDDIYGVYYTSGTTGFPKGAVVSQFTTMNNAEMCNSRLFERGPNNCIRPNICLTMPLFHQFAGVLGILAPIVKSGSVVLTGMKYNIENVVKVILKFQCNVIYLTPTILIDLLSHIERNNLTNIPLRTMLVAGSPVMAELINKAHKIMPDLHYVVIGYGSSENGCLASLQTINEPPETKPYTVGPPIDFTEIKIVDTHTAEITKLGQSGEIQTRGFNTLIEYYKDPDRTKDVVTASRWYRTGDLGILDAHGRLQIVGRIKDMIIKGGENVYPAEVEHILHQHPKIEDAHVCGVPDKRYGEEVCAWIKLKDKNNENEETKEEIKDFCKKRLTYFKVPKHILLVQEYPMTPLKKVKKYEMRAQSVKLLGLK